ncbi:hypothetical protein ABPG75_004859 [Micractinium tetrahymenae]
MAVCSPLEPTAASSFTAYAEPLQGAAELQQAALAAAAAAAAAAPAAMSQAGGMQEPGPMEQRAACRAALEAAGASSDLVNILVTKEPPPLRGIKQLGPGRWQVTLPRQNNQPAKVLGRTFDTKDAAADAYNAACDAMGLPEKKIRRDKDNRLVPQAGPVRVFQGVFLQHTQGGQTWTGTVETTQRSESFGTQEEAAGWRLARKSPEHAAELLGLQLMHAKLVAVQQAVCEHWPGGPVLPALHQLPGRAAQSGVPLHELLQRNAAAVLVELLGVDASPLQHMQQQQQRAAATAFDARLRLQQLAAAAAAGGHVAAAAAPAQARCTPRPQRSDGQDVLARLASFSVRLRGLPGSWRDHHLDHLACVAHADARRKEKRVVPVGLEDVIGLSSVCPEDRHKNVTRGCLDHIFVQGCGPDACFVRRDGVVVLRVPEVVKQGYAEHAALAAKVARLLLELRAGPCPCGPCALERGVLVLDQQQDEGVQLFLWLEFFSHIRDAARLRGPQRRTAQWEGIAYGAVGEPGEGRYCPAHAPLPGARPSVRGPHGTLRCMTPQFGEELIHAAAVSFVAERGGSQEDVPVLQQFGRAMLAPHIWERHAFEQGQELSRQVARALGQCGADAGAELQALDWQLYVHTGS